MSRHYKLILIFVLCFNLVNSYVFAEDDALNVLRNIISMPNQSSDAKIKLKDVEKDLKNNKKIDALDKLDIVINLEPNNYDILGLYVVICIGSGLWDRAINPAKKMVALKPDSVSYLVLGQVHGGNGMFSEAIENLSKATELDPANVGAHLYLGAAYVETGQTDKAKEEYEKLKKLDWSAAAELLSSIKSGKVTSLKLFSYPS